ncbi:MAG: sulfite exporter TauE/SafE family protein [Anaerolineae bacterium]|nr:sulfite exporter TauE/SafE family protein [Anaerolineae bacterium]
MLLSTNIVMFIVVGFIAQLIDGALGMAYGVSSTTFLLGLGTPLTIASMSVHVAQVFTTLVSGLAHLKLGNVDIKLFKKLAIPGAIGGVAGVLVLSSVPDRLIRPCVSAYLLLMGLVIIYKVFFRKVQEKKGETRFLGFLAVVGGFFDAVGGGGWGPIVTSTIMVRGHDPRLVIGSVNLAEFFVTLVQVIVFVVTLGGIDWQVVLGLVIGGIIAAPAAAVVCKRLPARALMMIVGVLITALSIRTMYLVL